MFPKIVSMLIVVCLVALLALSITFLADPRVRGCADEDKNPPLIIAETALSGFVAFGILAISVYGHMSGGEHGSMFSFMHGSNMSRGFIFILFDFRIKNK